LGLKILQYHGYCLPYIDEGFYISLGSKEGDSFRTRTPKTIYVACKYTNCDRKVVSYFENMLRKQEVKHFSKNERVVSTFHIAYLKSKDNLLALYIKLKKVLI